MPGSCFSVTWNLNILLIFRFLYSLNQPISSINPLNSQHLTHFSFDIFHSMLRATFVINMAMWFANLDGNNLKSTMILWIHALNQFAAKVRAHDIKQQILNTGDPRLMRISLLRISLLRFFKTFHKYLAYANFGLFHFNSVIFLAKKSQKIVLMK